MEIAVELLNQKMEEVIASTEDLWSKRFSDATRQVTKSLGLVEKAAVNLADAARRAWGSITRPTEQHALRLSDQIIQLCGSPVDTPDTSYDGVRRFEERSIQTAKSIAKTYNRYAGSIIRSAKSETSILEDSIMSLNRSVVALSELLDDSRLREIRAAGRDADRLVQEASRLRILIGEKAQAEDVLQELQDREVELANELSALSKDERLTELDRTEGQIKQKETEALALLEPLSKPLRKIDRPEIKLPAGLKKTSVSRLAENPLDTLLELPVSEIQEALSSLHHMIEHGHPLLDQRRKRKSLEAIEALRAGALKKLREDHSILHANRQEILRQLRSSGLYDQWVNLRNQIEGIRAEAAKCQARITDLQSQETQQRSLVLEQKMAIERTLENLLEEQVSIMVSF